MSEQIPEMICSLWTELKLSSVNFTSWENVSVRVPKGSITVMLGRNGAGKTTT